MPKKAKEPPELHKKEESLSKKRKESPNKKASTSKQEVTSKKKKEESLASVRQQISDKQNFDSPTQTVTKKVAHNPIIELSFIQPNALKDEIVKSGSVISPDEVIVVAQLASPISNRKSSQFAAKKMTSESNISLIGYQFFCSLLFFC